MTPIFLHGMWRSGSTYVWSRFRVSDDTNCLYEPLHQGLGRLTHDRINRDTPDVIAENAHPSMAQPYFAEYAPLIKKRGVKNYNRRLTAHNYILKKDDKDKALEKYINTLIENKKTKTPILGFNRTGLRIGWLKETIPSYNIYIDRSPRHVWASYQAQKNKGNYTFFEGWLSVLEKNAAHPILKPLTDRITLRSPLQMVTTKPKRFYRPVLDRMTPEDTYFMIFYMWLATNQHGLRHADMVIDMEQGGNKSYATSLQAQIKKECGLAIDFQDLRKSAPLDQALTLDWAAIEQEARALFPKKIADF